MSLTARKPAPDEAILKQHRGSDIAPPRYYPNPYSNYLDSSSSGTTPTAPSAGGSHPWASAPPAWVDDRATTRCMAQGCDVTFDGVLERRHHCRCCGKIFCQNCSSKTAMLPPEWNIKEPQRVCDSCFRLLNPYQATWVKVNANAARENYLEDDLTSRYLNSPLRFTLGGEIRKAAYTLHNLTDPSNVNFWARDVEYTTELLEAVEGILFMTVGKVAFIGGVRVGTGLVVARLEDGTWSAPCAVGSFGITFGACVGAEVTDMITGIDKETMQKFVNDDVSNVVLGGEASLAIGPFGRTAAGEVHVPAAGPTDNIEAYMSYSQSRGAFGGVTVEAAYVKVRDDVNEKFYGYAVKSPQILDGTVPKPKACAPLYEALGNFYAQVFPDGTQHQQQQRSNPRTTTTPQRSLQRDPLPTPPPKKSPFGQFDNAPQSSSSRPAAPPPPSTRATPVVVKAVPATSTPKQPTVVVAVPTPPSAPYHGEESAEL